MPLHIYVVAQVRQFLSGAFICVVCGVCIRCWFVVCGCLLGRYFKETRVYLPPLSRHRLSCRLGFPAVHSLPIPDTYYIIYAVALPSSWSVALCVCLLSVFIAVLVGRFLAFSVCSPSHPIIKYLALSCFAPILNRMAVIRAIGQSPSFPALVSAVVV